ncbi:phage tail terminator family protein [Paenibacillus sanguinis]|uniref:phage tail terminator family protein n=1 Tax=Paenibacillus sanguinis TaxID=225906 RepID=UPI00035C7548|nr:hypothetical protein [Paenibacillus sanguinis]
MITVNTVRQAVIDALDRAFVSIEVNGEEVEQGFTEPCFFVQLFPVAHTHLLDRRFRRNHSFNVQYFDARNRDLHAMAEELYDVLYLINVEDDLIRGSNMSHEIIDGVLHFFIQYEFQILRQPEGYDKMQHMEGI